MADYDIRTVAVDERRAATNTLRIALLSGAINDETFDQIQPSWDDADSIAAWEGDACVGHVAAFRFDSTVPGGARLATAGVTRVGVLPTHTRRGLLTRMMHQLLRESHERGTPLATLHASETSIYRRFGFGLATDTVVVVVTARSASPWRIPALPGSTRLIPYDEVLDVVPGLYDRVARWRVGSISRPAWMWPRILKDAASPTDAPFGKGSFVAVHSDAAGNDDGFVSYDVDWDETFGVNPTGTGKVRDVWGASPAVEVELWRYLLDIDLITTWKTDPRPVDEPVRRIMHDARAYEAVHRLDEQWVRILDVDVALAARSYGPGRGMVNVRVHDPMFASNTGTWTISADGAERNDGPADIEVDIATLSAAYLGGVSWQDLAVTHALTSTQDTLEALDALFASRPTPFCGTFY
jgi:predicted acetyltransferase